MDYIPPDTFDAPSSTLFPRQVSGVGAADLESLNGKAAAIIPFVKVDGMSPGNLSADVMEMRLLGFSGMAADLLDPPKFELESYIANYTGMSASALTKFSN